MESMEKSKLEIALNLLTPIALAALLCFIVYLLGRGKYLEGMPPLQSESIPKFIRTFAEWIQGREAYWYLYFMMLLGFPLGRWTLSIGVWAGFHPLLITVIGSSADFLVSLFVLLNWWIVYKIPRVGSFMKGAEKKMNNFFNQHPGIEKGSFLGMILFIAAPLQIGGFYAAIVSRLFGMRRDLALGAIVVGSLLGGLLVTTTSTLPVLIKSNPEIFLVVLTCVLLAVVFYYLLRRTGNVI
jgi:uncharacterized membrane protein